MDVLCLLAVPLVTGLLCRLAPRPSWIEAINAVGALGTLVIGLRLALTVFTTGPVRAFDALFYVDALSALLVLIIVVLGALAALYSIGYLRHDVAHGKVPADQLGWYY